jgi:hypothetical protein
MIPQGTWWLSHLISRDATAFTAPGFGVSSIRGLVNEAPNSDA